jgi:hypothetical protein
MASFNMSKSTHASSSFAASKLSKQTGAEQTLKIKEVQLCDDPMTEDIEDEDS